MSKIDDVRIKQYPSYLAPGEWKAGLGWRIERLEDGVWRLIAYRGDRSDAVKVAQQAADVLSSNYIGEQ
jgi:hypothetical protein